MEPQCYLLLLAVILLTPATSLAGRHQRFNKTDKLRTRARSGLADPTDVVCAVGDISSDVCSDSTELCGIDKATGEVQGCVPASQCPPATGNVLSCDLTKPSCCCRTTQAQIDNNEVLCNDVWTEASKCKQACSLSELKNFDFCKADFSKYVLCAYSPYHNSYCYSNEYCGIDRTTGELQGCVKSTECPTSSKGSKKNVCDPTKPSCCCQVISSDSGPKPDIECNNFQHPTDHSVWKEACRLPELKNLPYCKVSPTKRVNCMYKDWNGEFKREQCLPWEMCAIDKASGELYHCVDGTDASECPAKALGSEKIVCDGSASYCCCQKLENQGDNTRPCNDIENDKDSSIWQQACSLPELKHLDVCKDDPSKILSCSRGNYDNVFTDICKTTEICGIDKKTGEMKSCIDPMLCPAGSFGSEKIICDDKAPFCCCRKLQDKNTLGRHLCNNLIDEHDNTIWKYACSLPQLKNTDTCQSDPTKYVRCQFHHGGPSGRVYDKSCRSHTLCGIDKTTGELLSCLEAKDCPASAKNSDSIVCDAKAPYCCCQDVDVKWGPVDRTCNKVWDESDSKKWRETCKLKELMGLPICQDDPTKTVICTYKDANGKVKKTRCKESEMCGIDKANGEMIKCLAPSQCPAGAKGSEKIVCDSSSPNCCCQTVEFKESIEKHPCNYITNDKDSTIWKQACSLPELSGLDVCIDDPSKAVACKYQDQYGRNMRTDCRPSKFCGIDKNEGKIHSCIDASECPAGAKGSEKVVCDSSAAYCCCQKLESIHGTEHPCNDILNDRDSTIWKQACNLPELSGLDVCVDDPSKKIFCSFKDDKGEVTMKTCRPSEFCGINKTSGEMKQCVDRSVCPPNVKGSAKVVCDANAPFCCCQNLQGIYESFGEPCNNILNWEDTSVWEQACKLPELKPLEVCKSKPTKPTTPPPPTAPPTPTPPPPTPGPVKPEDMDPECLNFCKDEKPEDHPYLFRVYCGDAKSENTCPSPCPSACGKFCWDGRHMECPPFGGGPPPPPPRESEPSRGTDYVDLEYRSPESEAGFYTAFTIISLLVLLIFAACIYLCCMASGTVVAPLPFAAQQQMQMQQQAYQPKAFNSSTAATSSGTSLSSSESSLSSIAIKR